MAEFKQLSSEEEALEDVRVNVEAVIGMRWMAAVWCIDEVAQKGEPEVVRLVGRTTWNFPRGSFGASIGLLHDSLSDEGQSQRPPRPAPLKLAPFVSEQEGSEQEEEARTRIFNAFGVPPSVYGGTETEGVEEETVREESVERGGRSEGKDLREMFREDDGGEGAEP